LPLYMYFVILSIIIFGGAIATIMIGRSKENKEGNPKYDKQTKGIFTGLSLYYALAVVLLIAAFLLYLNR
jgi:hypothetical protein